MSTLDTFAKNIVDRHENEVAAGNHDEQCEFRTRGHYLCHCSKRRREAEGYTEPPGELIHNFPTCPRCLMDVDHDGDSWRCDKCLVTWSSSNAFDEGSFIDDYGELDPSPWDEK